MIVNHPVEALPDLASVLKGSSGIAGGPFTKSVEATLSAVHSGAQVRLTTSCTDALEAAALIAGIQPGDVVVVPSFGFVTTALAFVRAGAEIRFVDIEPFSLGIDPGDLIKKLDRRVRAVVPIHYAGYPSDIATISTLIADFDDVFLVEDNAHGLFGAVGDRPLGTFGAMSCLSFHGTKNISCGEGGALVVNDPRLVERAEIVMEKGTDRQRFLRGEVDKYTWRDVGSSFGLSDYLAALLDQQLARASEIQAARKRITETYNSQLGALGGQLGFSIPALRPGETSAYHIYYVVLDDAAIRDRVVSDLNQAGFPASTHFPALHRSPGGVRWGDGEQAHCPVTDRVAQSIVRLPLSHKMNERDAERAAEALSETLDSHSSGGV